MTILVLGSRENFSLLKKENGINYILVEDYYLERLRGVNAKKIIILDDFEKSYQNLKEVYKVAFSTIRGEGADSSLAQKLWEIENKVSEFRSSLLKELSN